MKLNSVVVKLGATIIFLQLIVLLPLGYITVQLISNYSYTDVKSQLLELSRKYAQNIDTVSKDNDYSAITNLAELTDMKALIIDSNGKSVYSTYETEQPDSYTSQKELQRLAQGESIVSEYKFGDRSYLKVGQPIFKLGEQVGGIILFSSLEGTNQSIQNITKLVVLASIGAVVLAIGFTLFISRKLASPLLQMEKATKKIADKKDFSTRVAYKGNDEIGSLAGAINNLSSTLEMYQTNRNEFFANITHELKTPLTYIKGYTQAIKKNLYQSEKEKNDYLTIIENETNQMNNLMDDLMDLSKIEEGKLNLHMEDLDLIELMETVVNKGKFKASKKGLHITYQAPDQVALIFADGQRMEQIFTNLLENAIRYTEQGSIHVNISYKLNAIVVEISDTGIGIAASDLPLLFDRFYRVDKSRSRSSGGTGLGLSIVKKLVEVHKGTIDLESVQHKGTKVTVTFPTDLPSTVEERKE